MFIITFAGFEEVGDREERYLAYVRRGARSIGVASGLITLAIALTQPVLGSTVGTPAFVIYLTQVLFAVFAVRVVRRISATPGLTQATIRRALSGIVRWEVAWGLQQALALAMLLISNKRQLDADVVEMANMDGIGPSLVALITVVTVIQGLSDTYAHWPISAGQERSVYTQGIPRRGPGDIITSSYGVHALRLLKGTKAHFAHVSAYATLRAAHNWWLCRSDNDQPHTQPRE